MIESEGEYRSFEGRLVNIRERVQNLEELFARFMSESIKQWTEERLRALELQVKGLRDGQGTKADNGCSTAD
jgi:hypothetical protein